MSRDVFTWIRLLRAASSLDLNASSDGASTTSLGNLGQGFTNHIVKNFFLISSLNLPSLSLKPFLLVLSQQALLFPISPLQVTAGCSKVSLQPSLLQAEQPQLSQPVLPVEGFQPSDLCCGLLWTCSNSSQNHRMFGVGRDLCGSSTPSVLPKQGHLQQAAQDLVQAGLEYLQRRRLHNLSGQPVPVLRHRTSSASVCSHCPLSCRWAPLKRVWPHPPDTHP